MRIWYFSANPGMGWITAGYTVNGRRFRSLVWSQAGQMFVTTGAKISGDLQRHNFTPDQTAAYNAFIKSGAWSVEYKEGIA